MHWLLREQRNGYPAVFYITSSRRKPQGSCCLCVVKFLGKFHVVELKNIILFHQMSFDSLFLLCHALQIEFHPAVWWEKTCQNTMGVDVSTFPPPQFRHSHLSFQVRLQNFEKRLLVPSCLSVSMKQLDFYWTDFKEI